MAPVLEFIENPTIVVVPPPNRGGRYEVEITTSAESRCGHRRAQARLWLVFVEAGEEAGREVCDVICSECDPARFARIESWAGERRAVSA
jgi:predicted RNA-binding protein with TRAM domain